MGSRSELVTKAPKLELPSRLYEWMLLLHTGTLRPSLLTTLWLRFGTQQNYSTRSNFLSSKLPSFHRKRYLDETSPLVLAENRCAEVTTWDLLRNMAEAFALVRAVEQKYGPVESFTFRKVRLDLDPPAKSLSEHI